MSETPQLPTVPTPAPATPAPTGRGIGIASLVTGSASILLAAFIGFVAGAVAIVLGIIGLKRPAARGLSIGGIITGAIGMLLSIVFLIIAISIWTGVRDEAGEVAQPIPAPEETLEEAPIDTPQASFGPIQTPCYEFDGPDNFINNIPADAVEACVTTLELWGEFQDDGTFVSTGVGAIWGNVNVEPIRQSFFAENVPSGSLQDLQAFLETAYFPEAGQSVIQSDEITLDGAPATVTFLVPNAQETQVRAVIAVIPEQTYTAGGEDYGFFLITVSTVEANGEEIINTLLDTWDWQ